MIGFCSIFFKSFVYWIFRFGFLHDVSFINRFVEIELDLKIKKTIPDNYFRKFTPFQARLVLSQLDRIDQETQQRIKKAELYAQGLKDIPELVIPPINKGYIYPVFPVQYQDRKKLLKYLMKQRRDVAAQHLKNCAGLPSFVEYYRDCPIARKCAKEVILLPTYIKYPISEVKKNIEAIKSYF